MLSHIAIKNFAIVEELDLELGPGMTVVTGETGAGKSIMIDALAMALGNRADSNSVRHGCERCEISATFDISHNTPAKQWLIVQELDDQNECILRRTINADGRSRAYINGQACPLQMLRALGNLLLNIHGQHEHQTLLKRDTHYRLLDSYAGLNQQSNKVKQLYQSWRQTQQKLQKLQTASQDRAAKIEFLNYQLEEFEKLGLVENELEKLEQEHKQLAHAEQLIQQCQQALQAISAEEQQAASNQLSYASQLLTELVAIDSNLNSTAELLNSAIIQTQEASNELQHYVNKLDLNPERLQAVEQRLSLVHDLARKHRVKPEKLMTLKNDLKNELQQLVNSDESTEKLATQLTQLAEAYQQAATKLSQARKKASNKLAKSVATHIQELGMPGGRFEVILTAQTNEEPNPQGLECIEFMVSANPGQPLQALAKVASGGELSRISLAIQVITAQTDNTPTLIFDEVDVGIGGGIAESVGQLLRELAVKTQILCVTHLPQVAAQGHQHLEVAKQAKSNITHTQVVPLNNKARMQELARMLGGRKITQQTLAHAKEMLESV